MTGSPPAQNASASLRITAGDGTMLGNLRSWVRALTGPAPDLELLVTELVTNAREHGGGGPITVDVKRHDAFVTVVVTNPSPPPPPILPTSTTPLDVSSFRGRGLQIVSAVTDQLAIEQVGDTLRISAVVSLP